MSDPTEKDEPKNALEAVLGNIEFSEDDAVEPVEAEVTAEVVEEEPVVKEGEEAAAVVEEEAAPELTEEQKADEAEMKALGIEKPDSRARFQELANSAREGREYKVRYEKQAEVFTHMENAGITGDQFGIMTAIAADVNSGDPVRQERAWQALTAEVTALSKTLGKEAPGFDPLAQHPDLRDAVESAELDRARALELASHRQKQIAAQNYAKQNEQTTAHTQAVQVAQQSLNALEAELKAQDPDYAAKRAMVVAILKPQMANISPDQWAATYAQVYSTVPAPVKATAKPVARPAPDNAGRPNGTAGGSAPKSMLDAVLQGIGQGPE